MLKKVKLASFTFPASIACEFYQCVIGKELNAFPKAVQDTYVTGVTQSQCESSEPTLPVAPVKHLLVQHVVDEELQSRLTCMLDRSMEV